MIGYFTIIVFRGPQGEASQPCTFSARSPLADFFLEFMSSYLITKQELQPLADVIACAAVSALAARELRSREHMSALNRNNSLTEDTVEVAHG